jgi:hypothetical protein
MRDSLFQITIFIGPTVTLAEKAKLPLQLEITFQKPCGLPPLVSVEAKGFYIPIDNSPTILGPENDCAGEDQQQL